MGARNQWTPATRRRKMVFAKTMFSLADKAGLSTSDLSDLINVSAQSIDRWRDGNTAPGMNEDKQATVLSVLREAAEQTDTITNGPDPRANLKTVPMMVDLGVAGTVELQVPLDLKHMKAPALVSLTRAATNEVLRRANV